MQSRALLLLFFEFTLSFEIWVIGAITTLWINYCKTIWASFSRLPYPHPVWHFFLLKSNPVSSSSRHFGESLSPFGFLGLLALKSFLGLRSSKWGTLSASKNVRSSKAWDRVPVSRVLGKGLPNLFTEWEVGAYRLKGPNQRGLTPGR